MYIYLKLGFQIIIRYTSTYINECDTTTKKKIPQLRRD
jgi:hypothetical protein